MAKSLANPSRLALGFYEDCEMSSIARLVVLLFFIGLCVCDTHAKPTAREYLKRGQPSGLLP